MDATAIDEIYLIPGIDKLMARHYLFPAVLAELFIMQKKYEDAKNNLQNAIQLAASPVEIKLLNKTRFCNETEVVSCRK